MHSNAIFMLRKLVDIVPFWNGGFCIFPSTRGLGGFFTYPASFAFDQKQTNNNKLINLFINQIYSL